MKANTPAMRIGLPAMVTVRSASGPCSSFTSDTVPSLSNKLRTSKAKTLPNLRNPKDPFGTLSVDVRGLFETEFHVIDRCQLTGDEGADDEFTGRVEVDAVG